MNDPFTWLTHWLADLLLLGSVLLLLAHLALPLLRQPEQRMTLAWGVILGLWVLMVVAAFPQWPRQSLWLGQHQEESQPSLAVSPVIISPVPVAGGPAQAVASAVSAWPQELAPGPSSETVSVEATAGSPSPLAANLLRLWFLGVVMALGWISLGAWQAVRLLRRSQESPLWMQQELAQIVPQSSLPRLRVSPRVATAVALCASRPHIVLPASSTQREDATGVRAALAHEWAHIRNGDLWLLALERLLLPVFFWHPLFWLFRRRIRFDQELLADAAAAGEQPVEYAEALLAWAKLAISWWPGT
jgi:beta-lactamase regulating signal transducer with metallopeptidase domain